MTDQSNAPAPAPQSPNPPPPAAPQSPPPAAPAPAASAAPPRPSTMSGLLTGVSQGEMLMLGGALLYLIGDLVFGVLTDYYSFSQVGWITSVIVAIMILTHARPSFGLSVPAGGYRFALVVLGLLTLVAAVRYLILDLMFIPGRSLNVMYFLGALVFYFAVAAMAAGTYLLWRKPAA